MGILDKAIEMLGDNHLPMMDARTRLLQAALSLVANNGQTGGLHGLAERFAEAGMGNLVHSWIGTGENLPVSGAQLQQVLGDGHLQQISEETGLSEPEAANQLSDMLPDLVDKLTPDGRIPQGGAGNMSALLDHFLGRYH
ncbi:MAG TPA: YidB family protein [Noviherbaspirillum sp.]|uniref:YidB family protein n=1 Tax=Noviherbaspirillum sp. TaxID=1926288 RepID=UPI002D25F587|nr:YidB family protein [Noviherbaspirillum sp.]HYD97709.1 YidB family protein [Noviherbaspirillum sp.]